MSLFGQGVVAIWNGIAPEGREEFYEWHNREHMPERIDIPGFVRGRRYIAKYGRPEYFTLYEAETTQVLSGKDYFDRLNNPTPWTRKVVPSFFRDTSRGVCSVKWSSACGDGGALITLQFAPAPGREDELEKFLSGTMLPPVTGMPGVLGIHLCIADAAASDVETAERKGRSVGIPQWLILVEGISAEAIDAACDGIVAGDLSAHGAIAGFDRGLYVLQNCREKSR
jgi:hypothetical protein